MTKEMIEYTEYYYPPCYRSVDLPYIVQTNDEIFSEGKYYTVVSVRPTPIQGESPAVTLVSNEEDTNDPGSK